MAPADHGANGGGALELIAEERGQSFGVVLLQFDNEIDVAGHV